LETVTRYFEEHIWPLNDTLFGSEWNPGIDGDSRLHIVSQASIEATMMGVFKPNDECPLTLCPDSNQREILYINLDLAPLNSVDFLTTIAHEYQHLVRYHVDGNEQRWLNEGLSQLIEHLNGFSPQYVGGDKIRDFLHEPDHHLNGWARYGYEVGRYYGAAYLFAVYLYERFGLDFIRELTFSDYDGLAAVHHTLLNTGQGMGIDEVFADWILANYLDDPYIGDGRYYYQTLDLPVRIRPQALHMMGGLVQYVDMVNQYGADYVQISAPGTYQVSFDGSDQAHVVGTGPRSGEWMWWSYDNDDSAARLTGTFDLTGLETATLVFSAWWDIEDEYDWLQVLVSDNGGQDWQIVGGDLAATGGDQAPGPYYSGRSRRWLYEQIDLSQYAGGPVQIRFEYLTDGSTTMSGVTLDDIGIVELGRVDDAENPVSAWQPEGFIRVNATVAQNWTVAVVQHDPAGATTVQHLALDAMNAGTTTISVPEGGTATLVIGAMAPFSSNLANYELTVRPRTP
jgi:immune inhibitor A